MKIAVGVVVFQIDNFEIYFSEYLESIINQTYKDFDLLIVNDNCDSQKLVELLEINNYKKYKILETGNSLKPAELRDRLILWAGTDFDVLIFSDADDFFTRDRVEVIANTIGDYAFCFHDLYIYKSKSVHSNIFFNGKDIPKIVNNKNLLLTGNFIGLGSSAINFRVGVFSNFNIPKDIIAFDWFFYTLCLLKGYKGVFVDQPLIYYRQHDCNIVGGGEKLNTISLKKGIMVKKQHFLELSKMVTGCEFIEYYNRVLLLEEEIKDEIICNKYIDDINSHQERYYWWENIII